MIVQFFVQRQCNNDGGKRYKDGGGEGEVNEEECIERYFDEVESTTSGIYGTTSSNLKRRSR